MHHGHTAHQALVGDRLEGIVVVLADVAEGIANVSIRSKVPLKLELGNLISEKGARGPCHDLRSVGCEAWQDEAIVQQVVGQIL